MFDIRATNLVLMDNEQPKFHCSRCEGWYLDEETLIEHTSLYHEYWCLLCNLQIKSENELIRHLSMHCVGNRCNVCRVVYLTTENALQHMRAKHSQMKDKFSPVNRVSEQHKILSRPSSSLHIRSSNTIKTQQFLSTGEIRVTTPIISSATNNDHYQAISKDQSEYLYETCNLTFKNTQEIATHMIDRHKVKIGIRANRDKEGVFIIDENDNNSNTSQIVSNGDLASLSSATSQVPDVSTSDGHNSPPKLPAFENTLSILRTESAVYPNSSSDSNQMPRLTIVDPSLYENRVTLVNSNNISSSVPSPLPVSKTSNYKKKVSKLCPYCDKILCSNYSLKRHLKAVHKSVTQNSETSSSSLKIGRVLSPSEFEAFELPNSSLQSPTSQNLSNYNDSIDNLHVEIDIDEDVKIINTDPDPIIVLEDDIEEHDIPQVIESDSDMEVQMLSERSPVVPKPLNSIRVRPSKRFLRKIANQGQRQAVNKREIAEKLKKVNRQLSLGKRIMTGALFEKKINIL